MQREGYDVARRTVERLMRKSGLRDVIRGKSPRTTHLPRRIVGWRVSRTPHTKFVLDALEQALYERRPAHKSRLVYHSGRGS